MFCPQCSTKNTLEQKYCRQCGQQLTDVRIAIRGGADEALTRYKKGEWLLSCASIFLILSVLTALTNIFLNPGPRNYAVIINLLIGLIIAGPMITAGIVRLRRARRALRLKDERDKLASGHSFGEETLVASTHPTALLLTPLAASGSITEGTTRHLQTPKRGR
jgi:hypothetical protein